MNKLFIVARQLAAILVCVFVSFSPSLAHTSKASNKAYNPPVPKFSKELVKNRLDNIASIIDLRYTHEVGRRIKEYTVNYRIAGEQILGKVDLYFPLFEQEISLRNLPDQLKFVAVVESHLDPRIESKSGAAGLWQFMPSTARKQGLVIDEYIDERKDPYKSTVAALEFLQELYETFGDWTLAIAAYNCGPGGVKKAMRRSGGDTYWEIRNYLPKETQKYVPRIIAAIYLMQYYQDHNLTPRYVDRDIKFTKKIWMNKGHNLMALSGELDMSYDLLRKLNPQCESKVFPASIHLGLNLPETKYEAYLQIHDPAEYKRLLLVKRELEYEELLRKEVEDIRSSMTPFVPIDRLHSPKLKAKRKVRKKQMTIAKTQV